jgi:hypothetical protein
MDKETVLPPARLNNTELFIIFNSCRAKLSHRDFRLRLVRNMILEVGRTLGLQITGLGILNLSTSQLEARHFQHWP